MSEATHDPKYTPKAVLYLAFELSNTWWNLGFSTGLGRDARRRKVAARDLVALWHEIRLAKKRFGLPEDAVVRSCYEAGRDGFWLHRCLVASGVENEVVGAVTRPRNVSSIVRQLKPEFSV